MDNLFWMICFTVVCVCCLSSVLVQAEYHYFQEQVTYQDAKSKCAAKGLTLATPKTIIEQNLLLNKHGFVSVIAASDYWIGLEATNVSGNFTWITGSQLIWTNWAEAQGSGGCVSLKRDNPNRLLLSDPFHWYVVPCWERKSYVCEGDCFYGNGENYRGNMNVTVSGRPCLRWSDITITKEGYPSAGLGSHNFPPSVSGHAYF